MTLAKTNIPKTSPAIESFLTHCHRRTYPNKSVIIHGGDTPDSLYYITAGSVSVVSEDDDGNEMVLAYLNAAAHGYVPVPNAK